MIVIDPVGRNEIMACSPTRAIGFRLAPARGRTERRPASTSRASRSDPPPAGRKPFRSTATTRNASWATAPAT
jgi:hypothetical protein